MSDSAFYASFANSDASGSQQTFSSQNIPPPRPLRPQTAAMPSANIITCRLCQQIFLEPVIFPCGHTFCLACSENWRKRDRVCPQAGCDKPLGEAVPNLLVKEAAISHHARNIMEANQQQQLVLQLAATLQQQLLSPATRVSNHPSPMTPCEANRLYDDDIEPERQPWIGAREAGPRKSRRNFDTPKKCHSEKGSASLEQTCFGEELKNKPSIDESPADGSPPLRPEEFSSDGQAPQHQQHQQREAMQVLPSTTRNISNKAFVRGSRGRRTDTHQMLSQPVSFNRRSLKTMFFSRRIETLKCGVWMGDEQQNELQECSDLASHPMNNFIQAKKDKSLWSKTKHIFSSNKAEK